MTISAHDVENEFRAILAADSMRAATAAEAVCGRQPRLVLEPATEQEIAAALRVANDAGLAVIPRGGGTKLGWGNPPQRADVILSTKRLDKIIEHVWADLTVSVEAGCTVAKLQAALAEHGQRLAVDPLWAESATIGGILSTNDSGALRLRFGALRDLIIGVTIALADGTLASSGGKVVKNVAGYDLPKLVTGALGTLGVITRAVFRLHPLPHNTKTLSIAAGSLEAMQKNLASAQDSTLAHTSLQARAAHSGEIFIDILFEGTEAGIAAQEAQLRRMLANAVVAEDAQSVWGAAQDLRSGAEAAVIAKIAFLPAEIGRTIEIVKRVTRLYGVKWALVMQAMGVGSLRLDGTTESLHVSFSELRSQLESAGGSLAIHSRPTAMPSIDAWGACGDALPLMRALKSQFDPKGTLNLGRFVGSI